MGSKYQTTKKYAKKPKITPLGMLFIAISIVFFIATQTGFFRQFTDIIGIACYIAFMVCIALSSTNGEGRLEDFVKRGINIFITKSSKAKRYNKLFDLFLSIAFAMGILHEEMDEEQGYMVEPEPETKEQKIARIQKELAELDELPKE